MKQSPQNNCSKMKGIETAGVPYLHQLGTQFYCICMQLWKALIISLINLEFKKVGLDNWWSDEHISFPFPMLSHTEDFSLNSPWGIRRKLTPGTLPASRKPYELGEGRKACDVWTTEQLFTILKQNGFNKT